MKRRAILGILAAGSLAPLSGCAASVHRVRGANTPLGVVVESVADEPRTVSVRVDRDGETVADGTVTFDADGAVTSTGGDDLRDGEFTTAGTYSVEAATDDLTGQTTADISWRELADCNDIFVHVFVREDSIDVSASSTTADCGGIDNLGA